MKDINVVFVNYLMSDDVVSAVQSVLSDIKDCVFDVQITVVDNSQNRDGLKEALKAFANVNYIDAGENIGFGRGNTLGFESTPARYYFALNRDTLIPENSRTIERIIKFMDANPKIGCIGPKLLNVDGSVQPSCCRFDLKSILIKPLKHAGWDEKFTFVRRAADKLLMKDFDHNSTRPVDWVFGAAMVVRKEAVDLVGWFDERFFMYMEDCDWCRSFWAHGWVVYYVHDIEIIHRHARGSASVPGVLRALWKNRLTRIHALSWVKFLYKWRTHFKHYAP